MRAAVIVAALAVPAFADNVKKAEALFNKAKELHDDKKYSEACPMFEKSDALDPGIGAKLNVAKCYEDWGMLARAYRWYVDAEKMASDKKDKRAEKIRELIATIDPDVPRIILKLPAGVDADAIDVRLDGKSATELVGKEHRIDPGPHEITWVVDGEEKSKTIPMERGAERELTLDVRVSKSTQKQPVDTPETEEPAEPASPGRTRRILGISVGAVGIVGLGVASYLTLDARSSYNDALDAHCMGMRNACSDEGLKITSDARSQANLATVITVISFAAIGGGIALYLTAPKASKERTVYVTPVVTETTGGIVVGGGF